MLLNTGGGKPVSMLRGPILNSSPLTSHEPLVLSKSHHIFLVYLFSTLLLHFLSHPPKGLFASSVYSPLPRSFQGDDQGTSLGVQLLRLHPSTVGSIPGWGTKIPHAVWHGQKTN